MGSWGVNTRGTGRQECGYSFDVWAMSVRRESGLGLHDAVGFNKVESCFE